MPDAPATQPPPARAGAPPPAAVAANRWSEIEVAKLSEFSPRASVSVVIVGPDPDGRLELTAAALAAGAYPASLLELVVASAGSDRERLRAAAGELALKLAGPGLERAASQAEGELLLFLRAGALPSPELVGAHARWHAAVCDAVSVGRSRPLDAAGLSPRQVAEAQSQGRLAALLSDRLADGAQQEALEAYLERTRRATERAPDLFRLAAQPNLALRAQSHAQLAPARAGEGEDQRLQLLELAYRAELYGCVFCPEPAALSYDHYPDTAPPLASPRPPHPRAESLVPVPGFRAKGAGRLFERPAVCVRLEAGREPAADVLGAVDAVLRGRLSDLELRLELSPDHPERELIAAACATDPRLALEEPGSDSPTEGPYQVRLPAVAVPDERTVADLHELMLEEGVGALHVTVPGRLGRPLAARPRLAARLWRGATAEVSATGPLARARRLAAVRDRPPEELLGELFGERWVSGVEVSVRRRGAPEPQVTEHGPLAPESELAHERAEHLRHRARAATNQARFDRQAQRAVRERMRANHERQRADRLEARLARMSPSYWVRWRARRALRRLRALPSRARGAVGRVRQAGYRYRGAVLARARR